MRDTRRTLEQRIDQALGDVPADLVIRGARILNVVTGALDAGDIAINGDTIVGTHESYRGTREIDAGGRVVAPGFIDSHVHSESTLVTPGEFDRCVLPRGTTTAVCDPHEIANVLGVDGVRYMLECAAACVMDMRVQMSSCVPATALETSGARLDATDLLALRDHPKALGLAEFMNVPGVLAKDPTCLDKLGAFQNRHIDGHAPLLSGRRLNAYLACGVRTCHETTGFPEGQEKLAKGMQVLIREGTVSKDLAALAPLIQPFTSPFVSLCTDDRNPLDIAEEGHLDFLIRRAIALGAPMASVYRAATWSAARCFGLRDRGLVAPGYLADLVLLDDLETCAVSLVVRRGEPVTSESFAGRVQPAPPAHNSIRLAPVSAAAFAAPGGGPGTPVIGIVPGKIITEYQHAELPFRDGLRQADPTRDLLKVCVLERHGINGNIGRGFVRGFGLAGGALASSVGHDSHNVCVVGASDADMAVAVNRLIEFGGGFVAARDGAVLAELALPVAGLMSLLSFEEVARELKALRDAVRGMGSPLAEPFLQLAFLALPVIPHLKITDRGLVDVDRFELVS